MSTLNQQCRDWSPAAKFIHMSPWSHRIQLHGVGSMSDREAISVYVDPQLSVN